MPDTRPLRPGDPEHVGDYRLTGLLGEGGQGIVYLGERIDESPDDASGDAADGSAQDPPKTLFAIKLLRTHLSGDTRARRYFARELAAAQRIDPSFTARIVEADVDGVTPYIVSEYVDGRALSDAVRADGPMSGQELNGLAVGTLNALIAIHQANVVHRDFKPSNVLLSADGPRVIDFGIARALDSTMSMTSGIVGTPAYMAPEQLSGEQVTPAVDVFAWAATMVFAATGVPPFGGDSIPQMMHRILTADPNIGAIQSPLRELVWYCLYKNPAQRPSTHQVLTSLNEASVPPAPAPLYGSGMPWGAAPVPDPQAGQARPWGADPNIWGADPSRPAGQVGPAGQAGQVGHLPPDAPPPATPPTPWGTGGTAPGGAVSGTTSPPRKGTRRRWLPAAAAAVALVAGVTVVAVELGRSHSSPDSNDGSPAGVAAGIDAALTGVVNPSSAKGGTLMMRQAEDFDSLDPADMYFTGSWNFSRLYTRALLTYRGAPGAAGLRPVPDLASAAGQPSADLRTWTYRLRSGITFEDGTPVTAKDVKYAVARTFATDVFHLGPTYFRELLDAGSYAGPYKDKNLDSFTGVTTPDDHTVVFHLKKPLADFDFLAALPQTAPVPAAKDTGDKYKNKPVSTGPYKIETYTATKSVSLVRNPSWHPDGIRTALPDRIQVTIGPDANAVDQALLGGQADLDVYGTGLQDQDKPKALAVSDLRKNTDTAVSGFLRYVALSTKVAPFDNQHCRLAVQYAVDRGAAQTADGGAQSAEPATNLAPPTILGSRQFTQYPTNTTKAKQELAACGKPTGFTTKIAIRQGRPKDRAIAQALQASLAKVGIGVTIQEYPIAQFYTDYTGKPSYVHSHGLGMILSVWGPDYPTALGFFPMLVDGRRILPAGNSNLSELNDPGVNGILDRLAETRDQKTREGLTSELDRKVMGTGAMVPLVFDKTMLYRNPRLTNATVSQMYGAYDLATIGVG